MLLIKLRVKSFEVFFSFELIFRLRGVVFVEQKRSVYTPTHDVLTISLENHPSIGLAYRISLIVLHKLMVNQ